jgi:hypothetical protein
VNNIAEAMTQGSIVSYADDSYLIFEGESWSDVCKKASHETTNVVKWLEDIGMVVNSSKTEAIYFSKQADIELIIDVANCQIKVGKTMRVLGVTFDSKLSWESHIDRISLSVKKKIHALRRLSTDLKQPELLNLAHGSIYSILYYAAGTWLNKGLHEKLLCRLKVLSNATLRIVFNKKKQDIRTIELHSLANMLSPAQMALHSPGCLLQKVLALKTPSNLYDLASVQVSYKAWTNLTIVTKDWTSSIGLSRFPNNAHDAIKLVTGDISQDKIQSFKKKLFLSIQEKIK